MLGYMPNFYRTSKVIEDLFQVEGNEVDDIKAAASGVLNQFFVDSATWGLDRWEQELGIPTVSGKLDSERRSVIKSKIRGVGTVTVQLVESVAEAYDRGSIEVTQQPALYQFTVRFVDTLGAPPNLDDLKEAIEEIKPAHLDVVYEYRYLLVNQIHNVMTINELQLQPLSNFAPVQPVV